MNRHASQSASPPQSPPRPYRSCGGQTPQLVAELADLLATFKLLSFELLPALVDLLLARVVVLLHDLLQNLQLSCNVLQESMGVVEESHASTGLRHLRLKTGTPRRGKRWQRRAVGHWRSD